MANSLHDTEVQELKQQLQDHIEKDLKLHKQRRKRAGDISALVRRCHQLEADCQAIL